MHDLATIASTSEARANRDEVMSIDDASFDRFVATFSRERPRYDKMAAYVRGLITDHCGGGLIHTTEGRAKGIDSFDKKCRKRKEDGSLRYSNPIDEITDLAGVRVIVFLRDSVDIVCNEIGKLFDVVEQEDVGERVYRKGKFGYQSKHLLIRLGDDRKNLVENKSLCNLVCEVQVRTLLQHAWAEMEHDIQYKSEIDIPLDLNKRFSALAGLLEIADREFASIQHDSDGLKALVKEDAITDLTKQNLDQANEGRVSALERHPAIDARDLIDQGQYHEALDYYSRKIAFEPKSYTLFIGRARANFLVGDVKSAVADLDRADEISGDAHYTSRLRRIIQTGNDPRNTLIPLETAAQFSADRVSASRLLKAGDGVGAFEVFSRLEAAGYNRAHSLFGKAMACALEKDIQGAKNFLSSLQLRPGTPMAVNMCALSCICDIIEERDLDSGENRLISVIGDAPHYVFKISPLSDLQVGFRTKSYVDGNQIEAVFKRLAKLGDNEGQ